MKTLPEGANGTYTPQEVAGPVRIPEGTLGRYRWSGFLLTTCDYLSDADTAYRLAAAELGQEAPGPLPPAKYTLEDVTRLRVLSFLGDLGWNRETLLAALGKPYMDLEYEARGDNLTPRDSSVLPQALVILAPKEGAPLEAKTFATLDEAHANAQRFLAVAIVVNLGAFREAMRKELAAVELSGSAGPNPKAAKVAERETA